MSRRACHLEPASNTKPWVSVAMILAGAARFAAADAAHVGSEIALTGTPSTPSPSARDVAGAPLPGDESGRTDELDPGDSAARLVGRGLLFVPRLALELALLPPRGAVWVEDRYRLRDRFYELFFNARRTVGLYPTASYASSFGLWAGLRLEDLDVLGARERLVVQATTGAVTGERYSMLALTSLRTGDRWAGLELGLDASVGRRPDDPFYGIGNGTSTPRTASPIDPIVDDAAAATAYRWQEARVALSADIRIPGSLRLRANGAVTDLELGRSTSGEPIDEVYDPSGLIGFGSGVRQLYGELELRFDTRRSTSEWEVPEHAAGTLASLSMGRVTALGGGADFWRSGLELQHYLRLAKGPRLLSLRLRGDAVSGSREQVPFLELPTLGGATFLRGYPRDRFRDRVAAVGSVAYEWDLSRFTDAYLFVDTGRVYSSIDAITAKDLRVGYGIGAELHGYRTFVLEGSLATSVDGGVFLHLSFNPVLDTAPRWR